jgi:UPF0271 protein
MAAPHSQEVRGKTMQIDINCDLGEGFPFDAELMPLITSANVACGFHAGDATTAFATVRLAIQYGVQVGAHPSFPDREHFGRLELERTAQQVFEECTYQVGAVTGIARAAGSAVRYIKPHGALYNMACRDDRYADPLVRVAELFELPLMGLPGSRMQETAQGRCRFIAEGFADRRYRSDGSLVPRSEAGAMIEGAAEAVQQAKWLIRELGVETLCVHGDNPAALAFVKALRRAFEEERIEVRALQ